MAQVFHMPPAPENAFSVFAGAPGIIRPLVRMLERRGHSTRFELDERALRICGTLYGRRIPRRSMRLEEARHVDLTTDTKLVPVLRTNGIGLPGYSAGWFRLANGDRTLVFVTHRERVVHVPTDLGYALLLSVEDPDVFLHALQRATVRA